MGSLFQIYFCKNFVLNINKIQLLNYKGFFVDLEGIEEDIFTIEIKDGFINFIFTEAGNNRGVGFFL